MKKISKFAKSGTIPLQLLGGLTPKEFLSEYWHKKPLLIRNAIPEFTGLLSPEELAGLACEEEVQSRLVIKTNNGWELEHGPFDERRFSKLPQTDWTLLVQEVNFHLNEAQSLIGRFNFIPHARLDDLMVSYAPHGGGVGPHFDSYDVFLLQGVGKRSWKIGENCDLTLVEEAPLRILKNFESEQEWILEAGDMLYLPPHVAHWGIAVGDCMTYSIGFRAPSEQELAVEFLSYVQEACQLEGRYKDPDLKFQKHPAQISSDMVSKVTGIINKLEWSSKDVSCFLGCYLSEPKPHVVFSRPRSINPGRFQAKLRKVGVELSSQTIFLFRGDAFFMNGELLEVDKRWRKTLRTLADWRSLGPEWFDVQEELDQGLLGQLHEWYAAGYLKFPD